MQIGTKARCAPLSPRRRATRALNDVFRQYGFGGSAVLSLSVAALSDADRDTIFWAVSKFDAFDFDLDPTGEHVCGLLECHGHNIVFLVEQGSHRPIGGDGSGQRTLIIMLLADYLQRLGVDLIASVNAWPFAHAGESSALADPQLAGTEARPNQRSTRKQGHL